MAKKISELTPAYSAWFGENGILSSALGAWLPASFATGAQGQSLSTGKVELINVLKDIAPIQVTSGIDGSGYYVDYRGNKYTGTTINDCMSNLAKAVPETAQKLIAITIYEPGGYSTYDIGFIKISCSSLGKSYTYYQLGNAIDIINNSLAKVNYLPDYFTPRIAIILAAHSNHGTNYTYYSVASADELKYTSNMLDIDNMTTKITYSSASDLAKYILGGSSSKAASVYCKIYHIDCGQAGWRENPVYGMARAMYDRDASPNVTYILENFSTTTYT